MGYCSLIFAPDLLIIVLKYNIGDDIKVREVV
jgi:hypothetical protein